MCTVSLSTLAWMCRVWSAHAVGRTALECIARRDSITDRRCRYLRVTIGCLSTLILGNRFDQNECDHVAHAVLAARSASGNDSRAELLLQLSAYQHRSEQMRAWRRPSGVTGLVRGSAGADRSDRAAHPGCLDRVWLHRHRHHRPQRLRSIPIGESSHNVWQRQLRGGSIRSISSRSWRSSKPCRSSRVRTRDPTGQVGRRSGRGRCERAQSGCVAPFNIPR